MGAGRLEKPTESTCSLACLCGVISVDGAKAAAPGAMAAAPVPDGRPRLHPRARSWTRIARQRTGCPLGRMDRSGTGGAGGSEAGIEGRVIDVRDGRLTFREQIEALHKGRLWRHGTTPPFFAFSGLDTDTP